MNDSRPLFLSGLLLISSTAYAQTSPSTSSEPSPLPEPASTRAASTIQAGAGFDYSRGDYGFAEDTEVFSVPLLLTYTASQWVFRASVPYTRVDGPADAVGTAGAAGGGSSGAGAGGLSGLIPGLPGSGNNSGANPSNSSNSSPARPNSRSEAGLGDVVLGATRMLGPVLGPVQVDLTARVKLPTADEDKGLGTGETDYYAQADFYFVGERFIPFGTLGYRILSDSDRYALENGAYVSIGSACRLNETTRAGVSLDWRQRVVDGGDDATEASVFVAHDFSSNWNLIVYALTGFTEASPDFGTGGSISYRF
jgi:hypothetical protein